MFHLVTGGSGSGKSVFAEQTLLGLGTENRIYVATMVVGSDPESRRKVDIHIDRRKDMDFETVEAPTGLEEIVLPEGANVLLEDVSNLLANEMFRPEADILQAAGTVLNGILHLYRNAENLVAVTNEIFSDGIEYDRYTRLFQQFLGAVNQRLALEADCVTEVVYGIPVRVK